MGNCAGFKDKNKTPSVIKHRSIARSNQLKYKN